MDLFANDMVYFVVDLTAAAALAVLHSSEIVVEVVVVASSYDIVVVDSLVHETEVEVA